jgi:hypothetical protein
VIDGGSDDGITKQYKGQSMTKDGDEQNKSSENLAQNIGHWLNTQGFSLEMRTARIFRMAGFKVSQFEHYIDKETGAVRQIDVIASLSENIDNSIIEVKLIIECKYAADLSPWIVLITPDTLDKYSFFSRFLKGTHPSNWKNIKSIQGRVIAKVITALEQKNSLSSFIVEKAGYTVKQTILDSNNKKDHAYEATVQVSKCVESNDEETENDYLMVLELLDEKTDALTPSQDEEDMDKKGGVQPSFYVSIAFPVIVIDGRLFEGYLSTTNEPDIKEVRKSIVYVPYRQREKQSRAQIILSPVTITTETHLDEYVQEIKSAIINLLRTYL